MTPNDETYSNNTFHELKPCFTFRYACNQGEYVCCCFSLLSFLVPTGIVMSHVTICARDTQVHLTILAPA